MTTYRTQFGVGEAKDLFYPSVLTPDLQLSAASVQDAFRRAFDAIYQINPPQGSRKASSVLSTTGFIDQFNVNLANNIFLLSNENWNSSTAGVSWNQHTLTYHGTAYTIAAGGPTTNKYIYWSLDQSGNYQTSATFPTLNFINPSDGSVASGLVAVWNSSDGKLYPFWSAKLAPLFVATALIEDLAVTTAKIQDLTVSTAKIADLSVTTAKINTLAVTDAKINDLSATKITTGTLAASVAITLTSSDSVPAKLNFGSAAEMFGGVTTKADVTLRPQADYSSRVWLGDPNQSFNSILLNTARNTAGTTLIQLGVWDNHNTKGVALSVDNASTDFGEVVISFGNSRGSYGSLGGYTFGQTALLSTFDLGTSGVKWGNIFFAGTCTGGVFSGTLVEPNVDVTYDLGTTALRWRNGFIGNYLLVGGSSTDVSLSNPAIVLVGSGYTMAFAGAATNASVGSLAIINGNYFSVSSGKTGSGTVLPIAFFCNPHEQMSLDDTVNATNTVMTLACNGSFRRVAIHNDGTHDYLYLV